jgi:hypothetical protein
MKQVTLIKMCLNETYSKVCICKHLSESFPIQNGLKKRRCFITTLCECSSEVLCTSVPMNYFVGVL